ncbi:MAG: hypothetical protein JWO59_1519 [Chloroflexi bacterium]|nr:hypothetical protein [Chloroflexota bacterium]
MSKPYNLFAGHSHDRLASLSDGVFAVAMTLLVLGLHVPVEATIHSEHDLWLALVALLPQLVTYLMSFLTLGIFWVGQQTQLNQLTRSDRDLTWIHLGFLLAVTLTPFSTALLADFITFRIAVVVYWLNILLLGAVLFASWRYASHAKLVKDEMTAEMRKGVDQRLFVAQALYALGAALCLFSTYISIAVIVLVQLNYVFAPRIGLLYRI